LIQKRGRKNNPDQDYGYIHTFHLDLFFWRLETHFLPNEWFVGIYALLKFKKLVWFVLKDFLSSNITKTGIYCLPWYLFFHSCFSFPFPFSGFFLSIFRFITSFYFLKIPHILSDLVLKTICSKKGWKKESISKIWFIYIVFIWIAFFWA